MLSRIEAGARLVSLTGPGGSGKTRLALEAATELTGEYRAGVFWLDLAPLRDPALVFEVISQALGVQDDLAEHIGDQEMLLVLDNLEQVIDAAPELAALLHRCPKLTLLVTSRELLRVRGEVDYPVPPLAAHEAVTLFGDRSQLSPSEAIAGLCARLDSLPLAVELAAARTKVLSPSQILERISQRLDLLTGGRDAEPRQQTLRATIEWSYNLLPPGEQRLLRALSVFAGGCTLDAAEEVAEADLDTLQSLVEKSLVVFAAGRYVMLESIHAFALEMLDASDEAEDTRVRHAGWARSLATSAEPELDGGPQYLAWLRSLDAELPNIRCAIAWAASREEHRLELAIAAPLWRYWVARGLFTEASTTLAHALTAEHDPQWLLKGLRAASWVAFMQADYDEAERFAQDRLDTARACGDDRAALGALGLQAYVLRAQGAIREALSLHEEALALADSVDDALVRASALNQLADCLVVLGETAKARELLEEAIDLGADDSWSRSFLLSTLGSALIKDGDFESARRTLRQAMEYNVDTGVTWDAAIDLELIAVTYAREEPLLATRLLGASEAALKSVGTVVRLTDQIELRETAIASIRDALSDEEFTQAWSDGGMTELGTALAMWVRAKASPVRAGGKSDRIRHDTAIGSEGRPA